MQNSQNAPWRSHYPRGYTLGALHQVTEHPPETTVVKSPIGFSLPKKKKKKKKLVNAPRMKKKGGKK